MPNFAKYNFVPNFYKKKPFVFLKIKRSISAKSNTKIFWSFHSWIALAAAVQPADERPLREGSRATNNLVVAEDFIKWYLYGADLTANLHRQQYPKGTIFISFYGILWCIFNFVTYLGVVVTFQHILACYHGSDRIYESRSRVRLG